MNITTLLTILQQTEYSLQETAEWLERHDGEDFHLQPQTWTTKLKLISIISSIFFFLPTITRLQIALAIIALPEFLIRQVIMSLAIIKLRRRQSQGLVVIAVAGSYGKTSTKWILNHVLSGQAKTLVSPESYNTLLGLSFDILKNLHSHHQYYVVEYGEFNPGDVKKLLALTQPQYGILTHIGHQHVARFKTFTNLISEFQDFVSFFIHHPDKLLMAKSNHQYFSKLDVNFSTYGVSPADYELDLKSADVSLSGTEAEVKLHDKPAKIFIPLLGAHQILNVLPSLWLVQQLQLDLVKAISRVKSTPYVPRRHEPHVLGGDITLLDNSYNSNLESATASLTLLKQLPAQRKLVITMGFVELGDEAKAAHEKFGKQVAQVADGLGIVKTPNAKFLEAGFLAGGGKKANVTISSDQQTAIRSLQDLCIPGTIILLENGFQEMYG